jgi:hypothetical protein
MKYIAPLVLAFIVTSCLTKHAVTITDRGEAFAHDTSIYFSEFRGEPRAMAREMTFDIKGQISVIDNFFQPVRPDPIVVAISPDSVRMLVHLAQDAGFFTAPDSAFEEPEEGTLDGPSHYHMVLNAGRRSKSIKTDGSDRSLNKLIGLSNVPDYWAWERMPQEKRWRWVGPAWTLENIRKLK